MKTFEVITTNIFSESKLPYSDIKKDGFYYIKNDKVCFKCLKYKETKKHIVECFNEKAIVNHFSKSDYNKIKSIKLLKEEETIYDSIAKSTAGENWYKFIKDAELLTRDFIEEYDHACANEVQNRYKVLGTIPPLIECEF